MAQHTASATSPIVVLQLLTPVVSRHCPQGVVETAQGLDRGTRIQTRLAAEQQL